jgi:hypothetical protein
MRRNCSLRLFCASIIVFSLGILAPAQSSRAAGLVDVPLKPWTYFDPYRDWMYTAIEKLAIAGLVGPQVLNTKPMSRMEMARIVATLLEKIREDEEGRFARRTDLEPVLYRLMEELAPELGALGVRTGVEQVEAQRWLTLQPLSHLQARAFAVRRDFNPEDSQGLKLARPYDGTVGFDSFMQVGNFMSGYIYPEFQIDKDHQDGRIVEGYLKLQYKNLAVRFGREAIWWGPGYHGSMLFSNNAPPLDQFRIGTAEPFILPWFLKYLGPTRMELLYARLEANRDFPHTVLGSWRVDFSPLEPLELGVARTVQMGGQGRPAMNPLDYLVALGASSDSVNSKYQTNQLYTIDGTLRLHDVDRVFPLSRDLALYAELEVDDTCCNANWWPLKPGYMVGLYLPNLFRSDDTDLRVEWAMSTSIDYTHSIWTSGLSYEGFPIAHYMGTRGQDLYIRATRRMLPNLQVGTEVGYSKVGSTLASQVRLPREQREYVGFDISFRPIDPLSLLLGYRYERIDDQNFVAGAHATNHIFRLEATYSFSVPKWGQFGPTLPPEPLRPVAQPPKPPDPDEILSLAYARKVAKDSWTVLTSPIRWDTTDWLIAGGVVAATGGAMLLDHEVRGFTQDNRSRAGSRVAQNVSNFGLIAPAVGLGVSYVVGEVFQNQEAKQRAADGVEASVISEALILYPMKFFLGRSRPASDRGSQNYRPFNISGSMPSFHTVEAFTAASVIAEHADNPWVSAAAYGLAAGVGASRIYLDKHWTSDVILSAAIGTVVGKAVVALNRERRKSNIAVIPLAGKEIWGAALQVKY